VKADSHHPWGGQSRGTERKDGSSLPVWCGMRFCGEGVDGCGVLCPNGCSNAGVHGCAGWGV
jgi:hypothetical protein